MARIRTVKPSFFKSFKLYTAEVESGLPLRVAFAGLWTVADREGRFRWVPQELKLDCLPHDAVDFSAVLEALEAVGCIESYAVEGRSYGVIPSFKRHQVINIREAKSDIPPPEQVQAQEEHVHARGEGNGREWKGREQRQVAPLPDWVDAKAWAEWQQHRKEIRKPLTPKAVEKQLKLLEQHKSQQTEIIEQSIRNSWTGLFPPRGSNGNHAGSGNSAPDRVRRANAKFE